MARFLGVDRAAVRRQTGFLRVFQMTIRAMRFFLATMLLAAAPVWLCAAQTASQKASGGASSPAGDWHGTSLCLVKPSACHDEEALYHVKPVAGKPDRFAMQADKVVDGKPEYMGDADCRFDSVKKLLRCDFPRGYVELILKDGHLDGAMFLPDKTRWREIKLVKAKP